MSDLLNRYQKSSLRISLLMFEDSLRHAQEWLDGREENGILIRRKLEISEGKRKQAGKIIANALTLIEKLAHRFELKAKTEEASAIMRGELIVSWENLMDTQAGKLKRYGKVHPDLAGLLDADIRHLADMSLRLSELLNDSETKEGQGTNPNVE